MGHIAQLAVLPAFAHAKRHSQLVAPVSDDPTKLAPLSKKYRVERTFSYDEYEEAIRPVMAPAP